MFITTRAILESYGQKWVAQLQDNIINTPDTGNYIPRQERIKMAQSIRYEVDDNGLTIYGGEWVFTYEFGRGPTVNDGDGAVRRNALAYIREEGIQPKGMQRDGSPIDEETLAFFISRKIHEQGSLPYRTDTPTGVLSDVISPENIKELESKLFFEIGTKIDSIFIKAIA